MEAKGQITMRIKSAKDLEVYKKTYAVSMEIFRLSRAWPREEKYSLIDQIRRSSCSVCGNVREAWAKRRYEAHFISKLSDSDGEKSETDTWLDYARDCGSLASGKHEELTGLVVEVGRMLGSMLNHPRPFLVKSKRDDSSDLGFLNAEKGALATT
jgi:four helix bundle protein